ncbi:MAG: heavy metal-associated domain-containing protein [Gammaproteobacteria bacterium]|jgi:copper chaperone CopZ
MTDARIELIYFSGCPGLEPARAVLREALAQHGLPPIWREWDRNAAEAPERVRAYGSPTILVDGRDVSQVDNEAVCCRVYAGEDGMRPAPAIAAVVEALRGSVERHESTNQTTRSFDMSDTNLAITGMKCGGCVSAVKTALEAVPGVASADVSLETNSAVVHGEAPLPSLIEAVEKAGYKAAQA